jgi:hypothetical protein
MYVPPSTTKEKMIAYLTVEEDPEDLVNPIDDWRLGIMQFVSDYWKKLETQITCPAKSKDPRACFQCPDSRVIACVVTNGSEAEQLIQLRKPTRTLGGR